MEDNRWTLNGEPYDGFEKWPKVHDFSGYYKDILDTYSAKITR